MGLKILGYISQAFTFLPLLIGLINLRYIKSYIKPVFIYIIASVIAEIITSILNALQRSFLVASHLYTLSEFLLISLFYILFFKEYFKPVIFYVITVAFILASLIFYLLLDMQHANHFDMAIESLVFTCYCLYLFYFMLQRLMFENLTQSPVFWINTAILFYFTGNLSIFIFSGYISNHLTGWYPLLWNSIHTFFNVSMNILFSIALWKTRVK